MCKTSKYAYACNCIGLVFDFCKEASQEARAVNQPCANTPYDPNDPVSYAILPLRSKDCCCSARCCQEDSNQKVNIIEDIERRYDIEKGQNWSARRFKTKAFDKDDMQIIFRTKKKALPNQLAIHYEHKCLTMHCSDVPFLTNVRKQNSDQFPFYPVVLRVPDRPEIPMNIKNNWKVAVQAWRTSETTQQDTDDFRSWILRTENPYVYAQAPELGNRGAAAAAMGMAPSAKVPWIDKTLLAELDSCIGVTNKIAEVEIGLANKQDLTADSTTGAQKTREHHLNAHRYNILRIENAIIREGRSEEIRLNAVQLLTNSLRAIRAVNKKRVEFMSITTPPPDTIKVIPDDVSLLPTTIANAPQESGAVDLMLLATAAADPLKAQPSLQDVFSRHPEYRKPQPVWDAIQKVTMRAEGLPSLPPRVAAPEGINTYNESMRKPFMEFQALLAERKDVLSKLTMNFIDLKVASNDLGWERLPPGAKREFDATLNQANEAIKRQRLRIPETTEAERAYMEKSKMWFTIEGVGESNDDTQSQQGSSERQSNRPHGYVPAQGGGGGRGRKREGSPAPEPGARYGGQGTRQTSSGATSFGTRSTSASTPVSRTHESVAPRGRSMSPGKPSNQLPYRPAKTDSMSTSIGVARPSSSRPSISSNLSGPPSRPGTPSDTPRPPSRSDARTSSTGPPRSNATSRDSSVDSANAPVDPYPKPSGGKKKPSAAASTADPMFKNSNLSNASFRSDGSNGSKKAPSGKKGLGRGGPRGPLEG